MTTIVLTVETVVLLMLVILVAGLLRSHAEILRRLHVLDGGIDEGDDAHDSEAPVPFTTRSDVSNLSGPRSGVADVVGRGLRDDAISVNVRGVAHKSLLAFLSSGCVTCHEFWEAFRSDPGLPSSVRLVIVTQDLEAESPSRLLELAPPSVLVVASSAAWSAYAVPGAPYFVLIDGPSGHVLGEGTGVRWSQVLALLGESLADDRFFHPTFPDPEVLDGRDRSARIDAELESAGIHPGDPSLYPTADTGVPSPRGTRAEGEEE